MNDILILLKQLLGIEASDTSEDPILNFYITKSKNVIKQHCVLSEEQYIEENLNNQTTELAMYYYQNKKALGLKNKSEAIVSKSFEEGGIPSSIKKTLPLPRIKFIRGL